MSAKQFLVTGGGGFLGAALVRRLLAEGHRVRVLDNLSRPAQVRSRDIERDAQFMQGDICDAATVRAAAAGVDSVVHLAAINGTELFYSMPGRVLEVGVRGFINVLDACRAHQVGQLVVASTSEVYQFPPRVPTPEEVPLVVPDVTNPRYSYAGSKIISELMALWCEVPGLDRVTIFRPHNVYGLNMGWEHVLPQFVLRALDAMAVTPEGPIRFPIQGDGSQTRAFMHIDDCIDGLQLLIEKGEHRGIYHIGNPEELTIAEVARKVVARFGRDAEVISCDLPAGGTARRCPDIARMAALGFRPKIAFDQGLPGVVDWYVANAHLRPKPPNGAAG